MIKMVATDIDGTIANSKAEFSPAVRNCIKTLSKNGVKVVLVTGRMHSSAIHVAKDLELLTPIISYQGGLIKDFDGKILYRQNLDSGYAKKIIEWADKNNIHINLYIDDKLYVNTDDEAIKKYVDAKYIDYTVCPFEKLKIENVNKILAIDYSDAERVTSWVNELRIKYPDLYIVKSTPYFCEIGSPKAKKSLGVEFLCDLWGFSKNEVLTIGDQNNDIDLIEAGGIGVAMGNATEELKQCADYVTDTIDNDGFVKAVEKFVFNV